LPKLESCDAPAGAGPSPQRRPLRLVTDVHAADATVPDVSATAPLYRNLVKERSSAPETSALHVMLKGGDRVVGCHFVDGALAAFGMSATGVPVRSSPRRSLCPGHRGREGEPPVTTGPDGIGSRWMLTYCKGGHGRAALAAAVLAHQAGQTGCQYVRRAANAFHTRGQHKRRYSPSADQKTRTGGGCRSVRRTSNTACIREESVCFGDWQ
jgi:hypothetical protein